ncbi:MAG: sodium:solute symporter family protein [Proteobacteria bacterium]|nr:sodium:solute symporter family protein [Pseudomonadota bacterium]
MAASTIDLGIIALYLLILIGIGYYASRKVKGTEDYTIAGRRLGYPVMLGTLIGTAIGAAATVGKAGKAYDVGFALFVATLAYGIGLILFGFIAPTIRKIEIWTIPDALALRYGNSMRIVTAVVMVLAVIALFGGQLIAVGLAVTSVLADFGITYTQAILGAGLIMVLYTIMGGLLAVAYTDLLQTLIMLVCIGILLPIFIIQDVGGASVAFDLLKPGEGNFWGGLTVVYIISLFLIDIPFCLVDPSLWQRASAAKDSSMIRKSVFITSGIYFYWSFIAVFMGVMAAHLFPGLAGTSGGVDSAIPLMVTKYMPAVLKGICLAAMMAIMMSTADTALLISGTTFSWDILRAFRPQTEDKTLLICARVFILVIGVLGVIFALNMKGIFDILLLAFAIFVSGIFVPTMCALFWKKATKSGALVSAIVASVAVVILYGLKLSNMLPNWIEPIIISIALSLILMVVVSLATYKPDQATKRLVDLKQ